MDSELYIDQADFREEANKQFKRLVLGKRVRLRGGLVIEGERCEKDADGNVVHVLARCVTFEPGTDPEDGVKPKGVIQWVSAEHGLPQRSGATTAICGARTRSRRRHTGCAQSSES